MNKTPEQNERTNELISRLRCTADIAPDAVHVAQLLPKTREMLREAMGLLATLAAENARLRKSLETMIRYARYEISDLPFHHPTLPSAIDEACATLNASNERDIADV